MVRNIWFIISYCLGKDNVIVDKVLRVFDDFIELKLDDDILS